MARRWITRAVAAMGVAGMATALAAAPAMACGGLVAPNGTVRLLRTSTLAAWHAGVEHYVTSFQFAGGGAEVGSIVPLPAVPTNVERGGDWTLQRLVRETAPPPSPSRLGLAEAAGAPAQVLLQTRIDALDLTVLRGGGGAVGDWAREHGFLLTPDAPAILDHYAAISPVFLAARFDAAAARARGQGVGDGTPIHLTIPLAQPWVPLEILTLGRERLERVQADVFLLTDARPRLLPDPDRTIGIDVQADRAASVSLLSDLRSDKGMAWVPGSMWLTKLAIDTTPDQLQHDLSVAATADQTPSAFMAGLPSFETAAPAPAPAPAGHGDSVALIAVLLGIGTLAIGGLGVVAIRLRNRGPDVVPTSQ